MISAKCILQTEWNGRTITTLQLEYPRFIHAEFLTHRAFSRNSSSSRAVPVRRMIDNALHSNVEPLHWGKNQPGMQAREELTGDHLSYAKHTWYKARDAAIAAANKLETAGAHKQIVNRILEPFTTISTLVTATEWDNFFNQRRHPDAQPEMKALADAMFEAILCAEPVQSIRHYPYVSQEEKDIYTNYVCGRISVARCARVSYLKHDGTKPSVEDDLKLYNRLKDANPPHWSPFEHVAYRADGLAASGRFGNFIGWESLRYILENE